MKKAVLLHGTDGSPKSAWLPDVQAALETRGYEVFAPLLPNNHTPNYAVYNDFLFASGWDFKDNLVIGHSSGAVSVLNLLMDSRCPVVATAVPVGVWAHMDDTELDRTQFKDTFPPQGFDFAAINAKAQAIIFVHGDNDPYCPLGQAQWLAQQLDREIVIIPGAGHLNRDAGYGTFPGLIKILEERGRL
jgi:hypothetical protein